MPDSAERPNLRWTKLNCPRIAGEVVRRARAGERLKRSLDRPLTLVRAPAGYGKTALLSDWRADSGYRHASQGHCPRHSAPAAGVISSHKKGKSPWTSH